MYYQFRDFRDKDKTLSWLLSLYLLSYIPKKSLYIEIGPSCRQVLNRYVENISIDGTHVNFMPTYIFLLEFDRYTFLHSYVDYYCLGNVLFVYLAIFPIFHSFRNQNGFCQNILVRNKDGATRHGTNFLHCLRSTRKEFQQTREYVKHAGTYRMALAETRLMWPKMIDWKLSQFMLMANLTPH